jgi:hypothetical protein
MAKKKLVFGQMTLGGSLALDWMKNETEVNVAKIEMGPSTAFASYNLPEWIDEKTCDIALLHPDEAFHNPVLITQRSIIRQLEHFCVEKEAEGADTRVEKKGKVEVAVLDFGDSYVTLYFSRDKSKGKYAPYQIEERN